MTQLIRSSGGSTSGSANVPVVGTDPATPATGDIWDLEKTSTPGLATGALGITYANSSAVFSDQFSVKTPSGVKRITLT